MSAAIEVESSAPVSTVTHSDPELDAAEAKILSAERSLSQRERALQNHARELWRRTLRLKHAAIALNEVEDPDPEVAQIVRRICRRPFPAQGDNEGAEQARELRRQALMVRAKGAEIAEASLQGFERELTELAVFLERETKELVRRQQALMKAQAKEVTLSPPEQQAAAR